jgi:hypothetical protein
MCSPNDHLLSVLFRLTSLGGFYKQGLEKLFGEHIVDARFSHTKRGVWVANELNLLEKSSN